MTELRSPGMRKDLVVALDVLATLSPDRVDEWPGLTEPDPAYLGHRRWPDVRIAAGNAHTVLTSSS